MSLTEERIHTAITQQAAEWYIANRAGSTSQSEREAFVAWLKQSPEHIREYLAVATMSRDLSGVVKGLEPELPMLIERALGERNENVVAFAGEHESVDIAAHPRRASSLTRRYSIAAVLCIFVSGISLWSLRNGGGFVSPDEIETRHGEQRVWQLTDGSVVHLNSASRIEVRYSDTERLVEVDRGQALFKVAHEAVRRFRVIAGSTEVVAVGTEFDVYRRPDAVIVTVVDGRVAVLPERRIAQTSVTAVPHEPLQLAAGEQARITADRAQTTAEPVDVRKAVAWVQREIIFEQQPLAEVTEEFNRYSRVAIEIEDAELRKLRISGVFNAYDTESFVDFLRRLDDVDVEATGERILVHRRMVPAPAEPMSAAR